MQTKPKNIYNELASAQYIIERQINAIIHDDITVSRYMILHTVLKIPLYLRLGCYLADTVTQQCYAKIKRIK